MQVGTFHSLCYRLLARSGTELSLADQGQAEECAGETIEALELACTVRQFLTAISLHKAGLSSAQGFAAYMADDSAAETGFILTQEGADRYQQALECRKLMDFDDLLLNMLRFLNRNRKQNTGSSIFLICWWMNSRISARSSTGSSRHGIKAGGNSLSSVTRTSPSTASGF